MQLETFRAASLARAMIDIRRTLGEDAVLVRTRVAGPDEVEVVATVSRELDGFRRVIEPEPWPGSTAAGPTGASPAPHPGPRIVALVGPPGSGKSSTIAKLALSRHGFPGRRVGVVTLDSYRPGAIDEMNLYAELAGLPLEIAYGRRDVPAILDRLADRDVILVDTPGRGVEADPDGWRWREILWKLDPHEIHLVVPAGLRLDVVRAQAKLFEVSTGFTHLLPSRVDELMDDGGLAELASAIGVPARWLSDGQSVPEDLCPATGRILSALGLGDGGGEFRTAERRRVS